jgi:hypothetical protein
VEDEDQMSQRAVERALGKLITDERFRERFFRDPQAARVAAGLNLSPAELDALMRTRPDPLRRLTTSLDDRICRLDLAGPPRPEELG